MASSVRTDVKPGALARGAVLEKNGPDLLDLLTQTGDGVFAVDPEGRIILWNRSAERILGHTSREVLGRACCTVMEGQDEFRNTICFQGCHISRMVKRGEPVNSYDMLTKSKNGREVWLNVSTLAIPSARRDLQVIAHFFRDVTARYQISELIRDRAQNASGGAPLPSTLLTQREREILGFLAGGAPTKSIAEKLHISPVTVRNHVQNILEKLGAHSRLEAVACAVRQGLLQRSHP